MKAGLGLITCLFLASGLAAAADTTQSPLFKQNGELCTAEEAANLPRSTDRGRAQKANACRTTSEWALIQARQADYDRDLARYRERMSSGSTGEGGPIPLPLRRR